MHIRCLSARRTRLVLRFSAALAALTLTAGCASTPPAYLFRPAAPAGAGLPAVAGIPQRPEPATTAAATGAVLPALPSRPTPKPAPARPRVRQPLRRAVALAAPHQLKTMPLHPTARNTQRVARPRQTAEVGLGTTVLGVLGLVVLPVSLIGLLIWGGPVWAILAGLAGLAVLVAYLDPFN